MGMDTFRFRAIRNDFSVPDQFSGKKHILPESGRRESAGSLNFMDIPNCQRVGTERGHQAQSGDIAFLFDAGFCGVIQRAEKTVECMRIPGDLSGINGGGIAVFEFIDHRDFEKVVESTRGFYINNQTDMLYYTNEEKS